MSINNSKENIAVLLGSIFTSAKEPSRNIIDKIRSREGIFNYWNYFILVGTFLLLLSAVALVYQLQPHFEKIHLERLSTPWGQIIVWGTTSLLVLKLCMLTYIFILYLRYKPIKCVSDEMLPTCTVIVPAYNEGKLVWQTLKSVAESNYPVEKLQLIAIDDGSKDDTWEWMQKAKRELGNRLEIYQQPKNIGKRHALYRGFYLRT